MVYVKYVISGFPGRNISDQLCDYIGNNMLDSLFREYIAYVTKVLPTKFITHGIL